MKRKPSSKHRAYDRYDSSDFSQTRGDTVAEDLDILLGDLCTKWGFCNRLTARELLSVGTLTASDFAMAVLQAEGFGPAMEPKLQREFRRVFVDRYGADQISA